MPSMKKIRFSITGTLMLFLFLPIVSCTNNANFFNDLDPDAPEEQLSFSDKNLTFSYKHISSGMASNIYTIWIENAAGEVQNLFTCTRAIKTNEIHNGDNVLAYWRTRPYWDNHEIVDVVTGPTWRQSNFTLTDEMEIQDDANDPDLDNEYLEMTVEERMGDQFTIYFEQDQSWENNEWFPVVSGNSSWDQPSVVYHAQIDLRDPVHDPSDPADGIELHPYGWSTMYANTYNGTSIGSLGIITEIGTLVEEMDYITNFKIDNGDGTFSFGALDNDNSSIRCIDDVRVYVTNK